jgi:uncharacterized protein YybS (DUF2232 family)
MIELKPFNREMGIAGLVYVLLLTASLVPPFQGLVIWLLPVPVIAFAILQSRIYAAVLSVLAGLVLIISGFGAFGILVAVALYFLAWSVGDIISRGHSPFMAVVSFTLVFIMLELVFFALVRWTGADLSLLKEQLSKSLTQESSLLNKGVSTKNFVQQAESWIKMMIPALVSITALFFAITDLLLLRWLLKAQVSMSPLLRNWRLPYSVLLIYLLSLVLILLNAFHTLPLLWQSIHNIEFIGSLLIGLQGIAFVWRKLQSNRGRYMVLVLLFVASIVRYVSLVYVVMGVLDILNETRRRKRPN